MSSAEEKFRAYNFDADQRWQEIERNLLIPEGLHRETMILKRKRKYYQRDIDPTYTWSERAQYAESSSNTSDSTSSSSSSSSSSTGSSSSTSSSSRPRPPPPSSSGLSPSLRNNLALGQLVLSVLAVVHTALVIIGSESAYSRAILLHVLAIACNIIRQNGFPKFNTQYLQQVMMDETNLQLFYCLVWWSSRPVFAALVPLCAMAAYQSARILTSVVTLPAFLARFSDPLRLLGQRAYEVNEFVSKLEIGTMALAIFQVFTPYRNLLTIFMLFQYLRMKYFISPALRASFTALRAKTDSFAPRLPGPLGGVYRYVVGFLEKFGQPPQAPQPGAGAGGLSSMCSIM